MKKCQLAIIGGGPAGLAAAAKAYTCGIRDIVILERDSEAGGILNQCIHNGFGLHRFHEELTGPEYAGRFIETLKNTDIRILSDTMVLDISPNKMIHAVNGADGCFELQAQAIILAMGCRERTRGAISIPGARCSGIFTAGSAQRFVNIEGQMVGKRIVILGSGDIGLIMARRMTLEGAKVLACVELMPYSSGLRRNIAQCLDDFGIPLYLSHTVTDIQGNGRLERVIVSKVDEQRNPIPGTEIVFDCDTLLLSVGLIPENELSRQAGIEIDPRTNGPVVYENMETSAPGVFACGNAVQVHDLVDFVSEEAEHAGESAAKYILAPQQLQKTDAVSVNPGEGITYTVPQHIRKLDDSITVSFRVRRSYAESRINVFCGDKKIASFKRSFMVPGEMEHVTLPPVILKGITGSSVTVSCEEVVL